MKLELKKKDHYKVKITFTEKSDLFHLVDDILDFVGGYQRVKINRPSSEVSEEEQPQVEPQQEEVEITEQPQVEPQQEEVLDITEDSTEVKIEPQQEEVIDITEDIEEVKIEPHCSIQEPFASKEDFKNALSLTTLSVGGYKNYMFAWNSPLWSKVGSPKDIFDYFRQRTNICETPAQFQELYKLFTLFFKFNDLRGYITEPKDLLTLKDLFDPVKSKKNSVSQKKKPLNATN